MYVFLFLIDGLGYYYLRELAPYAKPIKNCIPTITAPNWVSIFTGKDPKVHGVYNNESVRKKYYTLGHSTLFDDGWRKSWLITDWKMLFKYISNKPTKTYTKNVWKALKNGWNRKRPNLTVINTDMLDSIAHAKGWSSKAATKRIIRIENKILEFRDYLKEKNVPYTIVVTADHGGWKKNHENARKKYIRTVPLVVLTNKFIRQPHVQKTIGIRKWMKKLI